MQALATPSRVRILAHLRQTPSSVTDLADAVGMEQSAVSTNSASCATSVSSSVSARGRRIIYALHDTHVAVLLEEAVYHVEHVRLGAVDRTERAS